MTMSELTDRQLLAIEYMLDGDSMTAISDKLRVSRQTLHQWKRQPAFLQALELQRADRQAIFRERWHRMSGKVRDTMECALDFCCLETRLKAASLWLKHQALAQEPMPPLDATRAAMEQVREELRREIVRELTLEGKSFSSESGAHACLTECAKGTDHVVEELEQRLPNRPRELGLTPENARQASLSD